MKLIAVSTFIATFAACSNGRDSTSQSAAASNLSATQLFADFSNMPDSSRAEAFTNIGNLNFVQLAEFVASTAKPGSFQIGNVAVTVTLAEVASAVEGIRAMSSSFPNVAASWNAAGFAPAKQTAGSLESGFKTLTSESPGTLGLLGASSSKPACTMEATDPYDPSHAAYLSKYAATQGAIASAYDKALRSRSNATAIRDSVNLYIGQGVDTKGKWINIQQLQCNGRMQTLPGSGDYLENQYQYTAPPATVVGYPTAPTVPDTIFQGKGWSSN